MFWYGIEQLFLNHIIGNPSGRAYAIIAFTATVLVLDIPGGVFADKIGRKMALIYASCLQIGGLIVLGLSGTLLFYLLGCVLYGIYISLLNGASQALLYDHLAETGQTKQYARQQGRIYALFLVGAAIANLASGFIAHHYNLRAPYLVSLVPAVIALVTLIGIHESPIEKKAANAWYKHAGTVISEIRRHPQILLYSVRFMAAAILLFTLGEFGQIYILSFGVTTIALGVIWALAALTGAAGRILAHRMQSFPRTFITLYCLVLGGFMVIQSWYGIGVFLVFYAFNEALSNIAETEIQHATSSHVRATTLSVVGFVGNLMALPTIALFNRVYAQTGIVNTYRVGALIAIIALALTLYKPLRLHKELSRLTHRFVMSTWSLWRSRL